MFSIHSNTTSIISRIQQRIQAIRPGGEKYDKAMLQAASAQLSATVQRVHTDGRASDGSDIGQYSTAPIYVNPQRSIASFDPVGKTGKTIFAKTNQPHRTRYFDQGYRAYRQEMGLTADKVVLTMRGDLRDGLALMRTARGYGLGWTDEGLCDLAQSLEKKYQKKIWQPTEQERSAIVKAMEQGLSVAKS